MLATICVNHPLFLRPRADLVGVFQTSRATLCNLGELFKSQPMGSAQVRVFTGRSKYTSLRLFLAVKLLRHFDYSPIIHFVMTLLVSKLIMAVSENGHSEMYWSDYCMTIDC